MPDIFVGGEKIKKEESIEQPKPKHGEIDKNKTENSKFKKGHVHFFSSYCDNPPNVKLAERLENEKVLLLLRRHFITNIPWVAKALFFALIPLIIISTNILGLIPESVIPNSYRVFIGLGYYFIVLEYVFTSYLTWFYNISLVTTERILDLDFSSIVFENVAATKLSLVEDVSYQQAGVLRSFFDYGDVLVQTAGARDEFDFLSVPHPGNVLKVINSLSGSKNKK